MNTYKFSLPVFTTAICFCTFLTPTARATFLQGYVQQSNIIKPVANTVSSPIVPLYLAPALPVNSYPRLYEGSWQCMTIVTSSSMKAVEVGTKIACNVTFFRTADGSICTHFHQAGWTETKGTVLSCNKIEARADRTDYYDCSGLRETWIAHSQDHFKLVDPNSMIAESFIEQIHNGQLVGNYHTTSTLYKQIGP